MEASDADGDDITIGGGVVGQDAWMREREAATLRPIDSLAFATGTWEQSLAGEESQTMPGFGLIHEIQLGKCSRMCS